MSENKNEKQQEIDTQKEQDEQIRETGQLTLDQNKRKHRIELLTIIGEVEGHDSAPSQSKTTKYEHVLPTVSLVLGGGHSIGVPMAVSADYSFVVPSATMVIHPVRSSGMFIGVAQSYRNIEKIQDRITGFIAAHSGTTQERLEELMLDTSQLVKDVGTMLEGREAVKEGLINEIGGIREALARLHQMIEEKEAADKKGM